MGWWRKFKRLCRRAMLLDDAFLCDTCQYDYGDACRRPERPNAIECPDYRRLG